MTRTTAATTPTESGLPRIGVLLAGGASRRMGRDKASLLWRGRPLLRHMLDLLGELGLQRIVVSGDRDGVDAIPDRQPARGPLGGLASVAVELPDAILLVVPVDMPCLDAPLLRGLLDAHPGGPVHYAERPLPMRLPLDVALREDFRAWLANPAAPRAVHRLHARLGSRSLPVESTLLARLVNTNTPEDWEQLSP
jgi:molybdopterin-guanine dinucleotide biosynthesis protein A